MPALALAWRNLVRPVFFCQSGHEPHCRSFGRAVNENRPQRVRSGAVLAEMSHGMKASGDESFWDDSFPAFLEVTQNRGGLPAERIEGADQAEGECHHERSHGGG